ncbi:glycoside hydrolase [Serratia sp. S1B]|nr:glycoside hydrolase [Serratia sp. S1B]
MKNYGIYLCYQPTVDLRQEGLGRYLAAFIKGAENKDDIRFSIVCPSWSKKDLSELFESEGVSLDSVTIYAPEKQPIILKIHTFFSNLKKKRREIKILSRAGNRFRRLSLHFRKRIERKAVSAYDFFSLIPIMFYVSILIFIFLCVLPFYIVAIAIDYILRRIFRSKLYCNIKTVKLKIANLFNSPKDDGLILNLYQSMASAEAGRMLKIINSIDSVSAWYCPTAFWNTFTDINAPRLLCVPDVVLTRFPNGFSQIGDRALETFKTIQSTINKNEYFVTYSQDVKDKTLIDYFNIKSDNVYVINHAPNRLDEWLNVVGFQDAQASSSYYAKSLFSSALRKNRSSYVNGICSDFKFIFYASQLRPNKNVISLLKAYKYLLTNKYIQHKLILTGRPEQSIDVLNFVRKNNLSHDVLFMSNLSVQELAACYKLADLAVNPTLSEGGCPFTFTEALSVGTPVVMGRIGVTEEVLTDPKLQEMTFFDPYDWQNMADKIAWALDNLDSLREVQLETYEQLVKRTWEDVVSEHITAMDEIAEKFYANRSNKD